LANTWNIQMINPRVDFVGIGGTIGRDGIRTSATARHLPRGECGIGSLKFGIQPAPRPLMGPGVRTGGLSAILTGAYRTRYTVVRKLKSL
jgi:hypothetical protein